MEMQELCYGFSSVCLCAEMAIHAISLMHLSKPMDLLKTPMGIVCRTYGHI